MNDAATILVIILAIVLSIFLIIAIALTVYLIKLVRKIQTVADRVGETSVNVSEAVANVAKFSSPVFVGKFVMDIVKRVKSNKKGD